MNYINELLLLDIDMNDSSFTPKMAQGYDGLVHFKCNGKMKW